MQALLDSLYKDCQHARTAAQLAAHHHENMIRVYGDGSAAEKTAYNDFLGKTAAFVALRQATNNLKEINKNEH